MIRAGDPGEAAVAGHYDALDEFYREIWGEHVHHGLWEEGWEPPEVATRRLIERVAGAARIRPGAAVCDVGCGYGGTARLLADRYGARVTGFTLSAAQAAWARRQPVAGPAPDYLVRSWLDNGVPDAAADAVVAIESIAHMADPERAFAECARVLRPGGRLVVCDWLVARRLRPAAVRLLLEPICREGRLPGMATLDEYAGFARAAGLEVEQAVDLSNRVARTWTEVWRRALGRLVRDARYRAWLRDPGNRDREFVLTLARIPIAYRVGAMRYGLLVARRPLRVPQRGGG